ncbi:hypothetical protein M9Y10_011407 [Tritrichomonas musculus]|uniref:MI domain-containing protein n=1 Tax=Tritrichomonas musculus TaxID=1915356 RepID=A0ABR2IJ99_9EUKA
MSFINPFTIQSLKEKGRMAKALDIMRDLEEEEEILETELNFDFYRKHFVSMVQKLYSEKFREVVRSLRFFKSYVLLAKNRNLVEYFLKFTGSLRQIVTLFLEHDVPLVTEEALDLLLCIIIFVPVDFNPQILSEIAKRCVYLFSYGIYSLNLLLLDFIYRVCQQNKSFGHLIIENDAFDKSMDFILADCANINKLIRKECRAFDALLDQKFDPLFIPDVILKIDVYFNYKSDFSHLAALSMLEKMLNHGLNLSEHPLLANNLINLTAAPQKVLLQLLKTISKIKDKNIISHLMRCKDFRNNLAIQCYDMKVGVKARAKIFKLFANYISFFQPDIKEIIVIAALKCSFSSYIEKKNIFNYFIKICEINKPFAIDFGFAGGLSILSASLVDSSGEINQKIFNLLGLIGHAFLVAGRDLRKVPDYFLIAETLSELNLMPDDDINHDIISGLQKYYYKEEDPNE